MKEEELLLLLREAVGQGLPPGFRVPGYRLLRLLGKGSQGAVFAARLLEGGDEVAIKILLRPALPGSRAARRLEREWALLERLDHPGILRVLGHGRTAGGHPYLVQELLKGPSLDRVLPLGRPGPCATLDGALDLFLALCRAVAHAHKRGVLHRDLKPSNILLDAAGRPRVADFGVAVALEDTEGGATVLTRTDVLVGSLAYAAPEQLGLEEGDADLRSDIHALGAILHEILTGEPPLEPGLPLARALRERDARGFLRPVAVHRRRRAAGELPPGTPRRLPRDLDAVVAKATARRKEERYQSVDALAEDLERLRRGQPVRVRRAGAAERLLRLTRQHPLASLFLLLALAGLAATAWQAQREARLRSGLSKWALQAQALLLDDALNALGRFEGTAAERETLILESLRLFEDALREFPEDPSVRAARAKALYHLGVLKRDRGRPHEAEAAYLEALEEFEALEREGASGEPWRRWRSLTSVRLGDLAKEALGFDAARAWYLRAEALDRDRVAQDPSDRTALDDLFWSQHRLGDLAWRQDEFDVARARLREAEALATRLGELGASEESRDRMRLALETSWANLLLTHQDLEAARRALRVAVERARAVLAAEPSAPEPRARLAWALASLARAEQEAGDEEAARRALEECRSHLARVRKALPEHFDLEILDRLVSFQVLELDLRLPGGRETALAALRTELLPGLDAFLPAAAGRPAALQLLLGRVEPLVGALAEAGEAALAADLLDRLLEAARPWLSRGEERRYRKWLQDLRAAAGSDGSGRE